MTIKKIMIYGAPVLRKEACPVEKVDDRIKKMIKDMAETMYANEGVGLAANQVGVAEQIITVDAGKGLLVFINPRIVENSGEELAEEGCLSIPGLRMEIKRAKKIKVKALNIEGEDIEMEINGLLARIIQHEVDHLKGVLITDRVSFARQQLMKSQLKDLGKSKENT